MPAARTAQPPVSGTENSTATVSALSSALAHWPTVCCADSTFTASAQHARVASDERYLGVGGANHRGRFRVGYTARPSQATVLLNRLASRGWVREIDARPSKYYHERS